MSAHPIAGVILRLDQCEIHETLYVFDRSQRTIGLAFIKAAAEIHCHLHVAPLNIHGAEAVTSETEVDQGSFEAVQNVAKKVRWTQCE